MGRNPKSDGARVPHAWTLVAAAAGSVALGAWLFPRGTGAARSGGRPSAVLVGAVRPGRAVDPAPPGDAKPPPAAPAESGDAGLLVALRAQLADSKDDLLGSLAKIAETRPALAIDLAQALGRTDEEKSEWVTNVMQQWADQDAQAAWDWLGNLSSQRMQELAGGELTGVVLGTMAAHEPNDVVANLDRFLRQGNASEAISTAVALHLGMQALVDNGQVALARQTLDAWARDPGNGSIEAAAYSTVAGAWGKADPEAAGAWLRSLPTSAERNSAIASFTDGWAQKDVPAALAWAGSLAPAEGQSEAVSRAVSDCVESHPDEVGTWLGDYLAHAPTGPSADRLIETVINLSPLVQSSPPVALRWTQLISDPAQQELYAERTALRWAQQDRAAAMDFVQTTPLIAPNRK